MVCDLLTIRFGFGNCRKSLGFILLLFSSILWFIWFPSSEDVEVHWDLLIFVLSVSLALNEVSYSSSGRSVMPDCSISGS